MISLPPLKQCSKITKVVWYKEAENLIVENTDNGAVKKPELHCKNSKKNAYEIQKGYSNSCNCIA